MRQIAKKTGIDTQVNGELMLRIDYKRKNSHSFISLIIRGERVFHNGAPAKVASYCGAYA